MTELTKRLMRRIHAPLLFLVVTAILPRWLDGRDYGLDVWFTLLALAFAYSIFRDYRDLAHEVGERTAEGSRR